jgi:hypothetical protein
VLVFVLVVVLVVLVLVLAWSVRLDILVITRVSFPPAPQSRSPDTEATQGVWQGGQTRRRNC